MTVFISITALLTLLVVGWMVRPLWRQQAHEGVSTKGLNTAIYRDQLLALERDLANGAISQADFEATRDEVQLRLLDDTAAADTPPATARSYFLTGRRSAVLLALLLPLAAAALYWTLGAPGAIDQKMAAQPITDDQVQKMVNSLVQRLKDNPDNPKGWAMLARSYKVMGRFDEAEQAFAKVGALLNTDPTLMVDYADLLAVRANNNIEGKPLELVNKALALEPNHPMGLMMAGVAAYRRSDFKGAMAYWERLHGVLEPDSPDAEQVERDIADARAKAGLPPLPMTAHEKAETQLAAGATAAAKPAATTTPQDIQQMIDRLAERLKSNPTDYAGWARLARAYKVQGHLEQAEQAYARTGKLLKTDPDVLTQYADLLAMRVNGQLEGKPLALVNQALALNPKHPMALMMAAAAAYRRADYAQAITHWEKALAVLDPGSSDASQVKDEIADARAKLTTGPAGKTKP